MFTFRDGERLVRFGEGVGAEAPGLLAERGFAGYALLTTARAVPLLPALAADARIVLHVPAGRVPPAAAALRGEVASRPLVALGGGRVVDAAKAIAGADGLACAAIPTTLAGSPMTPFHRMPEGVDDFRLVRPSLVIADPELLGTLPRAELVATAINALAHAMEALYAPGANPVAELAALRCAELFAGALPLDPVPPEDAMLAALLGAYAIGTTGLWFHHAVCQAIVGACGTAHAMTNAVVLAHSARMAAERFERELGLFAAALGAVAPDPRAAGDRVATLAGGAGVRTLGEIGVGEADLPRISAALAAHPALAGGDPPLRAVEALVRAAL